MQTFKKNRFITASMCKFLERIKLSEALPGKAEVMGPWVGIKPQDHVYVTE